MITIKDEDMQNAIIEALELNSIWLKACLDCEAYAWDADQREAANFSYEYAQEVLRNLRGEKK